MMREAAQKFVGDHDYRNFCKVIDNNMCHGVVLIVCPHWSTSHSCKQARYNQST